jgi:DNA repair protein RadD
MDLPDAALVVVDEAHHAPAQTYRQLLRAYPEALILGMTATPCRGDGRGLGDIFEMMVETPPVAELIELGFLVGTRVYAPSRPDLTGVRVERGDYVERQLADRMDRPQLVGDVVTHWLRLAERRRTVVFASGVAHSVHLRDEFRAAGIWAEHIDGSTPVEQRDEILKKVDAGTVEVVCNAMVLTEGWDCPAVSCLVLARPTRHMGLYRQMVGRVLRPAPGKTDALTLDHAGAVFEHGFVEDPVLWTLATNRRAENPKQRARSSHRAAGAHHVPRVLRGSVRG